MTSSDDIRFRIDDVVRLRSGGPWMTVETYVGGHHVSMVPNNVPGYRWGTDRLDGAEVRGVCGSNA